MWQRELTDTLRAAADENQAQSMAAYMKHQFPFLGVPKPERARICRPYFKIAREEKDVDRSFIRDCWALDEREYQYAAADYLILMQCYLGPGDVPLLEECIISKAWWDTVDMLDRVAGDLALAFPEVNETLLLWSKDDNIWLRRAAIDHQLGRKDKTAVDLLERILVNNLNRSEFFINKAVGWSLREYSKTNPQWVQGFVERHRAGLSALSIREGGKYLP